MAQNKGNKPDEVQKESAEKEPVERVALKGKVICIRKCYAGKVYGEGDSVMAEVIEKATGQQIFRGGNFAEVGSPEAKEVSPAGKKEKANLRHFLVSRRIYPQANATLRQLREQADKLSTDARKIPDIDPLGGIG